MKADELREFFFLVDVENNAVMESDTPSGETILNNVLFFSTEKEAREVLNAIPLEESTHWKIVAYSCYIKGTR